jgi:hypothetical protein
MSFDTVPYCQHAGFHSSLEQEAEIREGIEARCEESEDV